MGHYVHPIILAVTTPTTPHHYHLLLISLTLLGLNKNSKLLFLLIIHSHPKRSPNCPLLIKCIINLIRSLSIAILILPLKFLSILARFSKIVRLMTLITLSIYLRTLLQIF